MATIAIAAGCSHNVRGGPSASAVVNESLQPVPPGPAIALADGDLFVTTVPGHMNEPRYPDAARAAKVGGVVTAQFIVNADGSADPASLKIVSVTSSNSNTTYNDAIVQSVRAALPSFRYAPATMKGKTVRQLVRTGFEFVAQ